MEEKEIWKDIPGYDGLYQLSSLDRVKRLSRYDSRNKFLPEMIMKPKFNRNCIQYGLSKNGKIKYFNLLHLQKLVFQTEQYEQNDDWKSVIGFEKYYEVSKYGEVRSKEYEEFINGKHVHRYPKVLSKHLNSDGYYTVKLRDNKQHPVHRLVADAFIENPTNLPEIDHIDADRKNNTYTNLRFVTHQENIRHTIELGNRLVGNTRSKNYNSKPVKLTNINNGEIFYFNCIMDACEFIKNEIKINTRISSMYSSIKKAFLNNKPYFGYEIEYMNKPTHCEVC